MTARILVVDDIEANVRLLDAKLSAEYFDVISATDGVPALAMGAAEATRNLPILAVYVPADRARAVKALELGFNDLLAKPIDPQELSARARTQIKRKRYTDLLRNNLDNSLELAVTDPLTGLHNRRYMIGQLEALSQRASKGGAPVAALLLDIDHFKKINDSFGHDVGDEVLREFAVRLASNVRAVDLPCRFGGEEFVVVMPETSLQDSERIAERIRMHVSGSPFRVAGGSEQLDVTISLGVAASLGDGDHAEALLKRADEAVYEAKAS